MVHGAGQQRLFHRSGADIACAGHRGACHSSSGLSPLRWLSMLQHIKKALKTFKKSAAGLGPTQGGTEVEPAKHFPPEKAESLLWVGHKRPGAAAHPNFFLRHNVRDMMIALLDGWGGLRSSEGLHLWLNDVVPDPERAGHALVVLNHPAEAKLQDTLSARRSMIARKNLLARDCGLEPRNEVTRGSARPSCLAPPRRIAFSEVFGG